MSNKKTIMAFSGLQILFFHLWINLFQGNAAEMFLKQTAYIGVDIFFFLSAYSLSGRKVTSYLDFLKNRFGTVYIKFFIFAIIAAISSGWKITKFLRIVSGVNLFTNGGGAFLWFLPAILIIYIIYPVFQRAFEKHLLMTTAFGCTIWLLFGILLSGNKNYSHIFIFWNRIPVILLGLYFARSELFKKILENSRLRICVGVILSVIGVMLMYTCAFRYKLQLPVRDMFYVMGIPSCVGCILLVGMIPETKMLKVIGSSTLEMYAVQMIMGYSFANWILKNTGSRLLTNACAAVFVIIMAVIFRMLYEKLSDRIVKIYKTKKENSK